MTVRATRGLVAAGATLATVAVGMLAFRQAQAEQVPAEARLVDPAAVAAADGRASDEGLARAGEPDARKAKEPAAAPGADRGEAPARPDASGAAAAANGAPPATRPPSAPLLHLVNGAGVSLYTLSSSEAATAVKRHGFKAQPNRHGYLWTKAFPGGQPVYRLTKVGGGGWVVTPSTAERDKLVSSGKFKNEGVLGYVAAKRLPGTVLLSRYRGSKDWRVELAAPHGNPQGVLAAGYKLDGPVGYVHPN